MVFFLTHDNFGARNTSKTEKQGRKQADMRDSFKQKVRSEPDQTVTEL